MGLRDKLHAFKSLAKESIVDLKHFKSPSSDKAIVTIVKEVRKNGICIVPNYYSASKCEALRNEIDKKLIIYKDCLWTDELHADERLFKAERVSNLIKSFHDDPFLKKIGEHYLKYPLHNFMTLANRISFKEGNLGSGGGWHRDSDYKRQFKSIVYLSDVNKDSGPFQIILGSASNQNIIRHTDKSSTGFYKTFTDKDIINGFSSTPFSVTGKAGTLVLVDTIGVHRGMPIKKGSRYALTNYYVGCHRINEFESYFKHLTFPKEELTNN